MKMLKRVALCKFITKRPKNCRNSRRIKLAAEWDRKKSAVRRCPAAQAPPPDARFVSVLRDTKYRIERWMRSERCSLFFYGRFFLPRRNRFDRRRIAITAGRKHYTWEHFLVWLMDVRAELNLSHGVFFRAASLLNHFMDDGLRVELHPSQYKPMCAAFYLVACAHEPTRGPTDIASVQAFILKTFPWPSMIRQVSTFEARIEVFLRRNLRAALPTTFSFATLLLEASNIYAGSTNALHANMCHFLLYLGMLHPFLSEIRPSLLAATAVDMGSVLAHRRLDWDSSMSKICGNLRKADIKKYGRFLRTLLMLGIQETSADCFASVRAMFARHEYAEMHDAAVKVLGTAQGPEHDA